MAKTLRFVILRAQISTAAVCSSVIRHTKEEETDPGLGYQISINDILLCKPLPFVELIIGRTDERYELGTKVYGSILSYTMNYS